MNNLDPEVASIQDLLVCRAPGEPRGPGRPSTRSWTLQSLEDDETMLISREAGRGVPHQSGHRVSLLANSNLVGGLGHVEQFRKLEPRAS